MVGHLGICNVVPPLWPGQIVVIYVRSWSRGNVGAFSLAVSDHMIDM